MSREERRFCGAAASIPAETLRAQLDRPLHRLVISPPLWLLLPAFLIRSCAVHDPLQSRPLWRQEQVFWKSGSMELDRRELYKLRRHKDPTSAVSNTTSGLTSIVLTLLPVSETLEMRQSNARLPCSKVQRDWEITCRNYGCVIPLACLDVCANTKTAIRTAEAGTAYPM